ncbi:cytochrome P450 monooxygenase rdc4 [Podospora aff. communis PSN243]|uniref:Cytochrome P450 monooxygenase rdc4 n=1 Tax=Podospora aff. communis PSN243 TaxID=3040156 RepID=A0AAV9GB05_9PEZI|nr:cytochrome P450 monooxygenase rdc4 [Podospora aff. communis PSN243]
MDLPTSISQALKAWPPSWTQIVLFVLSVFVFRAVYFANFGPLSHYPGPWYASASDMVYRSLTASGTILPWLQAQHSKYGPVVRVGPDRLSYINPQAWKDIYTPRGPKSNRKDPGMYTEMDISGHPSILTEPSDAEHARVRHIFSHAFSPKALKAQQPLLTKYVDQLIANISTSSSPIFDAVKLYNFTTFDIMADLTFGESLGMLQTSQYTTWVSNIFSTLRLLAVSTIWRESPFLMKVYKALEPDFIKKASRDHQNHSIERVKRRLQLPAARPDGQVDIWTRVLSQPEGRGLTPEKMYSNAAIFMLAGTETTATLLSGVTYYLLRNPEKLTRLKGEIRGAFAADAPGEFTMESLQKVRYLSAVLNEGLRLYPPVPSPLWRVTPEGGREICGGYVPGGTRVAVTSYAASRSEENFWDAEDFVPERWLGEDERYGMDKREVVQAFSVGARNCLGQSLAWHEMRLILAKIIWNFDMELMEGSERWNEQKCFVLWSKGPLMVRMVPRIEKEKRRTLPCADAVRPNPKCQP